MLILTSVRFVKSSHWQFEFQLRKKNPKATNLNLLSSKYFPDHGSLLWITQNTVYGAGAWSWCNSFNHYVGMRRYETVFANMCCITSRSRSCNIATNRVEHVLYVTKSVHLNSVACVSGLHTVTIDFWMAQTPKRIIGRKLVLMQRIMRLTLYVVGPRTTKKTRLLN